MDEFWIELATDRDLADLAREMRAVDRSEVEAVRGMPFSADMAEELGQSRPCYAARCNDGLICLFGCTEIDRDTASPWMLATDRVMRFQRALLTVTREYVARWCATYALLINMVDARNTTSVRWLRWLGFAIDPPQPYGFRGEMFHVFRMQGHV